MERGNSSLTNILHYKLIDYLWSFCLILTYSSSLLYKRVSLYMSKACTNLFTAWILFGQIIWWKFSFCWRLVVSLFSWYVLGFPQPFRPRDCLNTKWRNLDWFKNHHSIRIYSNLFNKVYKLLNIKIYLSIISYNGRLIIYIEPCLVLDP